MNFRASFTNSLHARFDSLAELLLSTHT
jgi:hypothetical protein